MKICKSCGRSKAIEGPDICVFCDGTVFEEKTIDQLNATCSYCGKIATEALVKYWIILPFYNSTSHEWYCGCKGWD